MNRQYIMVRAMSSQEVHFKEFFDNSVVAVGWSSVNFAEFSDRNELRQVIKETFYSNKSGPNVALNLNECVRFKNIQAGDYIIVPYYSGIALAIAEGEEVYSERATKLDLSNQRKVAYKYKDGVILSVPRNNLSEGLQRRLRVPGKTVTDLSEFSDEIEILFSNPDSYSYSGEAKKKADSLQKSFMNDLLENIQNGRTNLQTGGIGMEELVKELFICEGYDARILGKASFKGKADADVEAWREDSFSSVKIYAQVKHHNGITGREGIDQIIMAIDEKKSDGEDCAGVFVTSGMVTEKDRLYAMDHNISVIDGEKLVGIVFTNLSRLSDVTRNKLGILMVPSVSKV